MNAKSALRAALFGTFALSSGCAGSMGGGGGGYNVPQSRGEFVAAIEAGMGPTTVVAFRADRDLDTLSALLEERSEACLRKTVRYPPPDMFSTWSSTTFNPTVERKGDATEFTLQKINKPEGVGAQVPPGGLYDMAANVYTAPDGGIEVRIYRATMGRQRVPDAVEAWLRGSSTDCPRLR